MNEKDIKKVLEMLEKSNTKEIKSKSFRARLTPTQKSKLDKVCDALDITSSALIGVVIGMLYGYLVRQGKIKD